MLSLEEIEKLQSENELLQLQLQELNEILMQRSAEFDRLQKSAAHAAALQSQLDINLDEFYQMQDTIFKENQKAESASERLALQELELLQSIEMETAYYNMKDEVRSTRSALDDVNSELDEAASLYTQISNLTTRVSELESNLEIAMLENGFMKEELEAYRKAEEATL